MDYTGEERKSSHGELFQRQQESGATSSHKGKLHIICQFILYIIKYIYYTNYVNILYIYLQDFVLPTQQAGTMGSEVRAV